MGLSRGTMPGLDSRGLTADTINHYKVSVSQKEGSLIEAVFPRFNENKEHVANQIRYKDKAFKWEGQPSEGLLFGQELFPAGGRSITVTEGCYDAMAAFQITGSKYPNVAVTSASTAKKDITRNFEYLSSFDKIVINFDSDEPGQKAAKEVATLFEPGKVHILSLNKAKDANDYLMNGQIGEYVREWFGAPAFMPDGLKLGTEMWSFIRDHKIPKSVPYPWTGLNDKTYGMRLSEMTLLLAETGVGKTSVCKAIEYSLLMNEELKTSGDGVGFLHLEEPKYDTAIGLMSIHNSKPYHLPDVDRSEEELKKAYDEVINTRRVVIWDHFGSNDIDVVLAKIRHMAALGCRYIVLDHLSIVVSDQSGDERKQLDEISTKIKTLTMNLNIHVMCVVHVNRQGQVRGSAGPEQVSNIIFRLERDKKDPDPWRRNVTRIIVEKNRFCGRTGPACLLFFNEETNRLEELNAELAQAFENGGSTAGNEFDAF
jgi:twinkle protein